MDSLRSLMGMPIVEVMAAVLSARKCGQEERNCLFVEYVGGVMSGVVKQLVVGDLVDV